MDSLLARLHTSIPQPNNSAASPGAAATPRTALVHKIVHKSRDPNSTDYRFNINQRCIYERRLPGGSYITAHVQRLQSGYYDSPIVHEDRIENVRFVALNFVFHPARSSARFKSAEIRLALRRKKSDRHQHAEGWRPGNKNSRAAGSTQQHYYDNPDTGISNSHNALVRSSDALGLPSPYSPAHIKSRADRIRSLRASPPRFLRHAPHLLFGAISPETLTWNFNLAGSLGVSQGPANATLSPSGGINGSYKLYEMMRIQGSMRGLHRPFGVGGSTKAAETWTKEGGEDLEDGEIVWTLEENRLQKSGLPREFTFVVLLTKGCGPDTEEEGGEIDVSLDLEIRPVVGGWMGLSNASVPGMVNNLMAYRPLHKDHVDLDVDVGQRFLPEEKGWGFNFAKLAAEFDDFIWLPGATWATSEHGERGDTGSLDADDKANQDDDAKKGRSGKQGGDKAPQLPMLTNGDNTLNLRVILDHASARGITAASPGTNAANSLPYASLRPQQMQPPYPHSRGPSPLYAVPPASMSSSQRSRPSSSQPSSSARRVNSTSKRRSITITSSPPSQPASLNHTAPETNRQLSRSPTLRRRTSRSSLDKAYLHSSPPSAAYITPLRTRPYTIHDSLPSGTTPSAAPANSNTNSNSPHARFELPSNTADTRPRSWYDHLSDTEHDHAHNTNTNTHLPNDVPKRNTLAASPLPPLPPLRTTISATSQATSTSANTVLRFAAPGPAPAHSQPSSRAHSRSPAPAAAAASHGGRTIAFGGDGSQDQHHRVDDHAVEEKAKARVSVHGSNVSQTPYPFSPGSVAEGDEEDGGDGAADDGGEGRGGHVDGVSQSEGDGSGSQRSVEGVQGGEGLGAVEKIDEAAAVPQIKVPRKSSKRVSVPRYGSGYGSGSVPGHGSSYVVSRGGEANGDGARGRDGVENAKKEEQEQEREVEGGAPYQAAVMARSVSGVFHDAVEVVDDADGRGNESGSGSEEDGSGRAGNGKAGGGDAHEVGEGKADGDKSARGVREGEFDANNVF